MKVRSPSPICRGFLFVLLLVLSPVRSFNRLRLLGLPTAHGSYRRPSALFITESANRVIELGDWSVGIAKSVINFIIRAPISLPIEVNNGAVAIPVASVINKFRQDVTYVDDLASRTPQLTTFEIAILLTTISLSALSPFFLDIEIIEFLVPSLAALSASVGISAEYIGKIAVSNGKEFAALAIVAAAEAESMLAEAEKSKAVLPLCVGIATTASVFSLVAPMFLKELSETHKIRIVNEIYFVFPIVALLAVAVARQAAFESQKLAIKTKSVDATNSGSLLRTFSRKSEPVVRDDLTKSDNWKGLALGLAPSPILALIFPGSISTKTIVCAVLAAAQSAYYMAVAEYSIAAAATAVALKARSAAMSDFYANQASRASAILPFTSALAGFCAAASAAAVELLPFVNTIEQAVVALIFPSGAAIFAAAAAVSKSRCQVTNLSKHDNCSFESHHLVATEVNKIELQL